jgi:GDP-mannose 4,6-dehydratase
MDNEYILITGAGGFIGSHLVDFLIEKNKNVVGTYYNPTTDLNYISDNCVLIQCDIRIKNQVENILKEYKPKTIFHLAAQSYPTVSWEKPNYTIEANMCGTINIFESIKKINFNSHVLVACSSAEYGFVTKEEIPVKETHELLPLHPYGVSKVGQDLLAYQYFKNYNIDTTRIRIFNTTGPRKVNDVCSDFTKRIVLAENGSIDKIKVGNLETKRAFIDVRDLVNALYLATQKGESGEVYNICGNKVYKIQDILNKLLKLTNIKPEIFQDPSLIRPTDEPVIMGDITKFVNATGWKQNISLEKTLSDMLNFWRKKLK